MSRDWAYGFVAGAFTGVIFGLALSKHKKETVIPTDDITQVPPVNGADNSYSNHQYNLVYEPESIIHSYKTIDQERKEGKKDILPEPINYPEEAETLLLYSDNVLAFEKDDEVVYDIGEIIDLDEFEKFINSSQEAVYVADAFGNYYAIYKVDKTYSEMTGRDVQYLS